MNTLSCWDFEMFTVKFWRVCWQGRIRKFQKVSGDTLPLIIGEHRYSLLKRLPAVEKGTHRKAHQSTNCESVFSKKSRLNDQWPVVINFNHQTHIRLEPSFEEVQLEALGKQWNKNLIDSVALIWHFVNLFDSLSGRLFLDEQRSSWFQVHV